MSLNHTEMVECPRCREKSSFTVWTSLNTETDPEKKEEVLSGKIFLFRCPHCGTETYVLFPLLYHDPEHAFMVWFVPDSREKEADLPPDMKERFAAQQYRFRLTSRMADFVEKILIMEDGLNDVVIEAVKRDICASVVKSSPDFVFLQFEPSGEEGPSVLFQNLGDRQIVRIPLRPEAAELMTVIPDEPPRFSTVDREFLKENE